MTVDSSAFALPQHLAHKGDPTAIGDDERHFAAMSESLARTVAELTERLDAVRRERIGPGTQAMDRDLEIHRLTTRLRALRRYGLDLCLGRVVPADGSGPVYVGRLGLSDGGDADRLLVDWRSPAAEPFFAATHADPMGLASRRRYRWNDGRIVDYWDEVFTAEGLQSNAALDDQSAFIASLGASRSERMRDVLATIAADQDRAIRADSRGALVIDGGPGTGKTVVALHRAAYLLYADPRLGHHRGGVLFVGPHRQYLSYVSDVLPSLGEEGVLTCTLADLLPEGAHAVAEQDPQVARLKADQRMVDAVERAVEFYEDPPTDGMEIVTPLGEVWLSPRDWAEAFEVPQPGTPHNDGREEAWEALLAILVDKLVSDGEAPTERDEFDAYGVRGTSAAERHRHALAANPELRRAFNRAWPLLLATDLVADLWSSPAYLRHCAPWLEPEQARMLRRAEGAPWTVSDLPVLDAARLRLGDPEAAGRRRRREAAAAIEQRERSDVVEALIAGDDSELGVMKMLRGQDLRAALMDPDAGPTEVRDPLAGPFAHVVVDEAQELTDAEWRMLLARCPSRSLTIVGDRAQARRGFPESWQQRLTRVGLGRMTVSTLTVNYRTPEEVMVEAEPVIRAAVPDANVPISVRRTGIPVHHGHVGELADLLARWLDEHPEGVACVIGDSSFTPVPRVSSLTPEQAKGLEFDLVVLVDPGPGSQSGLVGHGVASAVDRYVAMTRTTSRLAILTSDWRRCLTGPAGAVLPQPG